MSLISLAPRVLARRPACATPRAPTQSWRVAGIWLGIAFVVVGVFWIVLRNLDKRRPTAPAIQTQRILALTVTNIDGVRQGMPEQRLDDTKDIVARDAEPSPAIHDSLPRTRHDHDEVMRECIGTLLLDPAFYEESWSDDSSQPLGQPATR